MSHRWDISPKEAVALQRELAGFVRFEPIAESARIIGGADCAFLGERRGRRQAPAGRIVAGAVLCDAESMDILERVVLVRPCTFPYVPGLLSFREAPAVIEAVSRLSRRPDLLMCDGQGYAHPRRLGFASHVGLWLDLPTIGVAKSRLCGEHEEPALARGSTTDLRHRDELIGRVVRTRTRLKPLYVSVGHRVTLDDAVRWTLRACRGVRVPEPTRRADRLVGEAKATLAD